MNFPLPIFFILAPLLLGIVLLLPRRWPALSGVLGSVGAIWLLSRLLALDPATVENNGTIAVWHILGRALVLSEDLRLALLFVYGGLALLSLLTILWPQETAFVPVGMMMLSPLTAGLMVQPFTYGLLALVAAASLGGVLVQTNRAGSAQGVLRYVILSTLTIPLFLLAGWILESGSNTFNLTAGRLLLAGTIILLAGFPFHIWVPALIREAPPLVAPFLLGLVQLLILLYCVRLLQSTVDLLDSAEIARWLRGSGAVTVVLAGLLATRAPTFSRLLGHLLLIDVGLLLISLTLSNNNDLIFSLMIARTVSLTLAGLGLSSMRQRREGESINQSHGVAREIPGAAALYFFGGLGLLGLPLTPGYTPHWSLLVQQSDPAWLAPILFLGLGLGLLGLLRCVQITLTTPATPSSPTREWRQWVLGACLLAGIGFSLYSDSWLAYTIELVQWLRPVVLGA